MYKIPQCKEIADRIAQNVRFIQVISGPRQVGKTTAARMVIDEIKQEYIFCSCDDPGVHNREWLESQWEYARIKADKRGGCILLIDEIQKIQNWSEIVKRFWDEDTTAGRNVKVVILGSSSVLIQKGLSESLAGRFELIRMTHWSFQEMSEAFAWDVDKYILFGGYPGAAQLAGDAMRWKRYINDSLIEMTVSKDILHMTRIDKPSVLRSLFTLGCSYSGQIVSYQKLLGRLQDAGNTTTLARYLHILEQAGLLAGIPKFSGAIVHVRQSTPKLQVLNNGLMTAQQTVEPGEIRKNPVLWGRMVESAVGAHLLNQAQGSAIHVYYWREQSKEVDFVLQRGDKIIGIEVKSSYRDSSLPGMELFGKKYRLHKKLLVGGDGIPVEEFLRYDISVLF